MDDCGIGVYYIDINWILQQTSIPTKIEFIKITDNSNNIRYVHDGINTKKFVYLNVEFSKKDLIKKKGGKWNKEEGLWYLKKSDYNENRTYIDKSIGDKIVWIENKCGHCCGTGIVKGDYCWFCWLFFLLS